MKERPILMSAPMVLAILSGTKTQTRRRFKDTVSADCVVFRQFPTDGPELWRQMFALGDQELQKAWTHKCPYGAPGDRLWVKETFARLHPGHLQSLDPSPDSDYWETHFRADGEPANWAAYGQHWKPSIFMPRWASRITLEIVSVRVERLNGISEADAIAEGIGRDRKHGRDFYDIYPIDKDYPGSTTSAVESYETLWESINGPGSWALNPYVWVIEFSKA